jgi:N-acetylmuramoyl-L-alanine amidase
MDIGAEEIRAWHTDPKPQGNGWSDIGYHFVIRRSGAIEPGRPVENIGTHVRGHNSNSVAVCLVGGRRSGPGPEVAEDNFTNAQLTSLRVLVGLLLDLYPNASVCGHRDFPGVSKQCPSFNAREWWLNQCLSLSP